MEVTKQTSNLGISRVPLLPLSSSFCVDEIESPNMIKRDLIRSNQVYFARSLNKYLVDFQDGNKNIAVSCYGPGWLFFSVRNGTDYTKTV